MSKCNGCGSELPQNAKFCPECGTSCVADNGTDITVNAEKNICDQCGLELPEGAKFCTVCGGRAVRGVNLLKPTVPSVSSAVSASTGGMMEAVTVENNTQEEMPAASVPTVEPMMKSEPMVAASANSVSQILTEPVAVMEEDTFIPEMGNIPEMGSITETSVMPTPSVASSMTASAVTAVPPVSETAQSAQPVQQVNSIPQPVSTAVNTAVGTLPDMGNTAASANTVPVNVLPTMGAASEVDYSKMKPVKKMKLGAKIGIIAGSVVAAAAVAAGVFFVADKATFLSTILGKEKYAVMVESQYIKSAAETINTEAIVKSVETLSNAYSSMPMMEDYSSYASYANIDLGAYVRYLNEMYLNTYGSDSLEMKISASAEAGESLKSLAGQYVPVDEIVSLIDGMELTYDITAAENAFDTTVSATIDTLNLDCRVIISDNNEMYLALPFVSEKAFLVKLPQSENTSAPAENVMLSLDKNELDRVISEIIEAYLMKYKEASIEMEKGSVTVLNTEVEGKVITAEFKGEALEELFADIVEVVANDDYLCNAITSYLNEMGMDISASDYYDSIMDSVSFNAKSSDKLVVTTVINNNGEILAKHLKAVDDDEKVTVSSIFSDNNMSIEIAGGEDVIAVKVETISDTEGKVLVSITDDGSQMKFSVKYSGIGTEQFCGQPTAVGTYTIAMEMPDSFEDQLGAEAFAAINGMTLTVSQSVSSGTANAVISLDAASYGSLSIASEIAVKESRTPELPGNVIDMTYLVTGMSDVEPDYDALKEYFDEFGNVYNNQMISFFKKYDNIFGEMPGFENPFDDTPGYDEVLTAEDMEAYILEDVQELTAYAQLVEVDDSEMIERISALSQKYSDLYYKLSELMTAEEEISEEALATLEEVYWDLYLELWDIEVELDENLGPQSLLPDIELKEVDKMEYTDIEVLIQQCDEAFYFYQDYYSEAIESSLELKSLYDTADYARIDVDHDWDYFTDALSRGSININLLNGVRSSLKEYITAIEALEEAIWQY